MMAYSRFYDFVGMITCGAMVWYEIPNNSSPQAFLFELTTRMMMLFFIYHLTFMDESNQ